MRGKSNWHKRKEKGRKFFYLVLCLAALCTFEFRVQAQEEKDSVLGTLQVLMEDTEIRQAASEDSEAVGILQAGTTVIVVEKDSTWSRILCQKIEGYVPSAVLGTYVTEAKSLDAEMNDVAQEEQRTVEEFELYRREKKASMIWEVVIMALIVSVLSLGVVSAVKNARVEKAKKKAVHRKKKRQTRRRKKRGKDQYIGDKHGRPAGIEARQSEKQG